MSSYLPLKYSYIYQMAENFNCVLSLNFVTFFLQVNLSVYYTISNINYYKSENSTQIQLNLPTLRASSMYMLKTC